MPFERASAEAPAPVAIGANSNGGSGFMTIAFQENERAYQPGCVAVSSRR
jgi:hypothetical protein